MDQSFHSIVRILTYSPKRPIFKMLTLAFLASFANSQGSTLQLTVSSNFLDPVQGSVVKLVDEAGAQSTYTTGINGNTAIFPSAENKTYSLEISGGSTLAGQTLGMTRVLDIPPSPVVPGLPYISTFETTLPLLQPVYIGPSSSPQDSALVDQLGPGEYILDDCLPRLDGGTWRFGVKHDASYGFSAAAACLTDVSEIESFLAFRGITGDYSEYKFGLVIRSNSPITIGFEDPIEVEVWSPFHDFSSDVTASCLFLSDSPEPAPPGRPHTTLWGSRSRNGSAYTYIYSDLGAGDTVLLFKDGTHTHPSDIEWHYGSSINPNPIPPGAGPGQVGYLDSPVNDTVTAASNYVMPLAAPTGCTPPPPEVPECADPGSDGLGQDGCGVDSYGLESCKDLPPKKLWANAECLLPGNSATYGFSTTVHTKSGVETPGGTAATEWGFSITEVSSREYTANPNHPNGTCYMQWKVKVYCTYGYRENRHKEVQYEATATGYCFGTEVIFWRTTVTDTIPCADYRNKKKYCSEGFHEQTMCAQ